MVFEIGGSILKLGYGMIFGDMGGILIIFVILFGIYIVCWDILYILLCF